MGSDREVIQHELYRIAHEAGEIDYSLSEINLRISLLEMQHLIPDEEFHELVDKYEEAVDALDNFRVYVTKLEGMYGEVDDE